MDFLTPKDISMSRYVQNHEWMEEIFSSAYSIGRIIPGELGLGRKGELEALTQGFFNASTHGRPSQPSNTPLPRVGKLAPGQAEEFTMKATAKVEELKNEIETMKKQHAKRMAKLNKGHTLMEAEKQLRRAKLNYDSFDDELKYRDRSSLHRNPTGDEEGESVGEICHRMEILLDKQLVYAKDVVCEQKGSLEDQMQPLTGAGLDYDTINSSDRFDNQNDTTSFALQQDAFAIHPVSSIDNTARTPHGERMNSSGDGEISISTEQFPTEDVDMIATVGTTDRKPSETNEWVMVDKESDGGFGLSHDVADLENFVNLPDGDALLGSPEHPAAATGARLETQGTGEAGTAGQDFHTHEFSEVIEFGNVDSAGAALSGYGEGSVGMGDVDSHGHLELDHSAFGEAFHGAHASPGRQADLSGS